MRVPPVSRLRVSRPRSRVALRRARPRAEDGSRHERTAKRAGAGRGGGRRDRMVRAAARGTARARGEAPTLEAWRAEDAAQCAPPSTRCCACTAIRRHEPGPAACAAPRAARASAAAARLRRGRGARAASPPIDEIALRLRGRSFHRRGETRLVDARRRLARRCSTRASPIAIRFSPASGGSPCSSGEAWFEVAPDASRPFVVEAGGGTRDRARHRLRRRARRIAARASP